MKLLYHNKITQQDCWLAAEDHFPVEKSCLQQVREVSELSFERFVATPDLHTGPGIPNGFVLDSKEIYPHLIGGDIGCGMRLIVLENVEREEVERVLPILEQQLLKLFFGGERGLVLSAQDRQNLMLQGVAAVGQSVSPSNPYFDRLDWDNQVDCSYFLAETDSLPSSIMGYAQRSGPDPHLGSLGGGNHFCEFVELNELVDRRAAHSYGARPKQVGILVHSGSLALGKAVAHEVSANPIKLQTAATNFAWYNRFSLAHMALLALEASLGKKIESHLVYDSPHNFIEEVDGIFRHRKGATPSPGASSAHPWGTPVLVPGSMGSYSYLLASLENEETLLSAPHGAGRSQSRNKMRHSNTAVDDSRVVNPMKPFAATNGFLKREYEKRLAEEASGAYKPIETVVEQVEKFNTAKKVARLSPILTVKG